VSAACVKCARLSGPGSPPASCCRSQ
jgi:hypothetical protein